MSKSLSLTAYISLCIKPGKNLFITEHVGGLTIVLIFFATWKDYFLAIIQFVTETQKKLKIDLRKNTIIDVFLLYDEFTVLQVSVSVQHGHPQTGSLAHMTHSNLSSQTCWWTIHMWYWNIVWTFCFVCYRWWISSYVSSACLF